jgi:hypothetical protein
MWSQPNHATEPDGDDALLDIHHADTERLAYIETLTTGEWEHLFTQHNTVLLKRADGRSVRILASAKQTIEILTQLGYVEADKPDDFDAKDLERFRRTGTEG